MGRLCASFKMASLGASDDMIFVLPLVFQFPWVTFCLSSGFVQSSFIKERETIMRESSTYFTLTKYLDKEATKTFTDYDIGLYKNLINTDRQRLLLNAPKGQWHKLGVQKNDFIVDCWIGTKNCYDNFTLYMSGKFFNCYTLKDLEVDYKGVGPEEGLSVILAGQNVPVVYQYHIWSKSDDSTSVRVVIHEKNTLPQPINDGIEIIPGMSSTIGIVQKKLVRINTPKSKCTEQTWINGGDIQVAMSLKLCVDLCYAKYVYSMCDCAVLGTVGRYGIQNELVDAKFCLQTDLHNLTQTVRNGLCYLYSMASANNNVGNCLRTCIWNCEHVKYDYTISYSKWPEEMVVEDFAHNYIEPKPKEVYYRMYYEKLGRINFNNSSIPKMQNELSVAEVTKEYLKAMKHKNLDTILQRFNDTVFTPSIKPDYLKLGSLEEARRKWVQETFYRVNIYFKQPVVEVHKQILNSDMADLWSAIGGIVGLWLGLTVVGAVEILELAAKLLQLLISRCFTKDKLGM